METFLVEGAVGGIAETFLVGGAVGGIAYLILLGIRALSGDETVSHDSNELNSTDQHGRNSVQREKAICSDCRDQIATYINPPLCRTCRARRSPNWFSAVKKPVTKKKGEQGRDDGPHDSHDELGRLQVRTFYKDNEALRFERYYENGSLYQKGSIKNAELHGPFERFDESGRAVEKGHMNMGKRCGKWWWRSEASDEWVLMKNYRPCVGPSAERSKD